MNSKTSSIYEIGMRFINSKVGIVLGTLFSLITLFIGAVCLILDLNKDKYLIGGCVFILIVGILGLVHTYQQIRKKMNGNKY